MVKFSSELGINITVSLEKAPDPANDRLRLHCTRPDPNGFDITIDLPALDAELLKAALAKELAGE